MEEVIPRASGACARCGAETAVIGYDESEQLDVEPARYFVRVTKREKRACPALLDGDGGAAGRAHRGERVGQRRGGDQYGGGEVLRPLTAVPAGRDDRARKRGWRSGARRWMVG